MIRKATIMLLTAMAVVTVLAWIGSYIPRSDGLGIRFGKGWWTGWIYADPLRVWVAGHLGELSVGVTCSGDTQLIGRPLLRSRQFAFAEVKYVARLDGNDLEHELAVPFSVLTILFAAYPTIAFIRGPLRRWRRRRKGLCLKCGYRSEERV